MKTMPSATFFVLILLAGCNGAKQVEITPLSSLTNQRTTDDRGRLITFRNEYYLVSNYHNNRKCHLLLDSLVEKKRQITIDTFAQYSITLYKKSDKTNAENILRNPRVIDRYSNEHDLVLEYVWVFGKFLNKYRYRKGRIINEGSKIEIKDIE